MFCVDVWLLTFVLFPIFDCLCINLCNNFVGFQSVVSPSKPKLELLNAPLLVSDYKSLPNEKFEFVTKLLSSVHEDRGKYVKVVFDKNSECFEIVPASKPVSSLSYE